MSDQASELFWSVCTPGGSPQATCCCGRIHFASGTRSEHDYGELERLQDEAAKEPDRFVEDSQDDSIAIATIDGVPFCYGCPCGKLARYENFIWHNREMIVKYIKKRVTAEAAKASADQEALAGL